MTETAEILSMDDENIEAMNYVNSLRNEVKTLNDDFKKLTNFRIYLLERDTIEISALPENISDDQVEDEVLEIMKEAKATNCKQATCEKYE